MIMLAAEIAAVVPEGLYFGKRLWLFPVDLLNEGILNLLAVAAGAGLVNLEGFEDQVFLGGHDVGDVPDALGGVWGSVDVDVDPAGVVDLATGGPKRSDQFLDRLDVGVLANRADQFALLATLNPDARVAYDRSLV